ncbi:MAG: M28 family peptidase [Candidatus Latescibacteria bacterium]|nr:M28 family peptidase [Candidatus Latescibacterota bacterium]
MNRRDFLIFTGISSSVLAYIQSCSSTGGLSNSRHLVDTPEKREQYLAKLLKELCTDLGPHPIGSPAMKKAEEIVKREMERSLPFVELDTFTFERWVLHGEPELNIGDRKVESYPGHGTLGAPPEGITGTIINIDDEGGIIYGVQDTNEEIVAYISMKEYIKAVPLPFYSFKKTVKSLPTFHVGTENRSVIEDAIEKLTPVKLYADVEFFPNTPTSNVVGTLPGKSSDEIVFLAHLDTVYNSQGANDNTASVIVMIILAHALSGTQPKKTMTFIATTGEEYDKLGAINYVENRKKAGTLQNIKYIVNFDSLTWGPNMQIATKDEELRSLIDTIDRELKLDGTPTLLDHDGFQLDARPFRETGARAMYVNSRGYTNEIVWHRPEDTPETVPVDCAEIGFRMFYEYIKRIQEL